jgi:hypothetical protein
MKKTMLRNGAAALLFLGVLVFNSGPAQAEPPNHPGKCGEFTGDPFACRGHIICTNDGDFMCCTKNDPKNDQAGETCEKIEAFTTQGGLRFQGGLHNANPSTGTGAVRQPVLPNTKAPTIMRRGIEGEQAPEPTPGTPTSPEQPSGTKPQ